MRHGLGFAQHFEFKQGQPYLNQGKFLRDRQHNGSQEGENDSEKYQLIALPVSLSLSTTRSKESSTGKLVLSHAENVHLTSLVVCSSRKYGILIALGDRGGNTEYRGVQVYQVQNNAEKMNFLQQIKQALYKPIKEEEFSELLKLLQIALVHEIPCMEQLRGYCGYQSAGELKEFSLSLFSAMHNVQSSKGRPLNLVNALETGGEVAVFYHMMQMNDFRLSVLKETICLLQKHPEIHIGQRFFDDLHLVEQRYGVPSTYRPSRNFTRSSEIPPAYQHYLKQQRYPTQDFSLHELSQIERALNRLFSMFKSLSNDFDSDLLFNMKVLDNKISYCHQVGFSNAEYHYRDLESIKTELSTSNPFIFSRQTLFNMVCEKYEAEHPGEGCGPGAIVPFKPR